MIHKKSNHTFVIAEAGSNWKTSNKKSSISRAKKMISIAAKAGADAIKFQTYSSTGVYVPNAGTSDYLSKSGIKKSINELFSEYSMSYEILPILHDFCKKNKIQFMSTPFSIRDAKAVNKYVKLHKIASYEINHLPLLKFLAKTKKPIIISTGASTTDDIDYAIKNLKKFGAKKISILQCTSCYPAPIDSLNLSTIQFLKNRYKTSVGLSDHSISPFTAPLLAIGYGATIIEKHFTLNKKFSGPDHSFAIEPTELKELIRLIREADLAKGNGKKQIQKSENELSKFATRSIQAITQIKKDEILHLGQNFDILRPGKRKRGINAKFLSKVEGKKSKLTINSGDGILLSDLKN